MRGEPALLIDFEDGIRIERTVDAMARSATDERVGRGGLTPPVIPGREASPEPMLQTVSKQSVECNALSGIVSASGFRASLLRPRNDGVV